MGIFTYVWVTHLKMVSSKTKIASEIQYTFFFFYYEWTKRWCLHFVFNNQLWLKLWNVLLCTRLKHLLPTNIPPIVSSSVALATEVCLRTPKNMQHSHQAKTARWRVKHSSFGTSEQKRPYPEEITCLLLTNTQSSGSCTGTMKTKSTINMYQHHICSHNPCCHML